MFHTSLTFCYILRLAYTLALLRDLNGVLGRTRAVLRSSWALIGTDGSAPKTAECPESRSRPQARRLVHVKNAKLYASKLGAKSIRLFCISRPSPEFQRLTVTH